MNINDEDHDVRIRVDALRFAGIDPNARPHHAVQRLYELGLGFAGRTGQGMADLLAAVQHEFPAATAAPEMRIAA